jgi:hypothetical protein
MARRSLKLPSRLLETKTGSNLWFYSNCPRFAGGSCFFLGENISAILTAIDPSVVAPDVIRKNDTFD